MPYSDQLSPWVVYRLLPNFQRILLERFRKRTNAEAYVRVLRQIQPDTELVILFEVERAVPTPASTAPSPTQRRSGNHCGST